VSGLSKLLKQNEFSYLCVGRPLPDCTVMSSSLLIARLPSLPPLTSMSAPLFLSRSPYPSDRERVADVTTFLLAGHDTTGYQMSWIVIEISRHPSVLLKIRSELDLLITDNAPFTAQLLSQMKYLTMVIREGMRLWPVLPIGSNRVASRDIQYKEFVIPRGSTLGERGEIHALSCPVLSYPVFPNPVVPSAHRPQGPMHRSQALSCLSQYYMI
jgi:Cytochrome P450